MRRHLGVGKTHCLTGRLLYVEFLGHSSGGKGMECYTDLQNVRQRLMVCEECGEAQKLEYVTQQFHGRKALLRGFVAMVEYLLSQGNPLSYCPDVW